FVISGYVIASSLYNSPGKTLADVFLGFYTRRVKRLVPALILCVVITGVLICLFDERPGASLKTGITSLFGRSYISLLRRGSDSRPVRFIATARSGQSLDCDAFHPCRSLTPRSVFCSCNNRCRPADGAAACAQSPPDHCLSNPLSPRVSLCPPYLIRSIPK